MHWPLIFRRHSRNVTNSPVAFRQESTVGKNIAAGVAGVLITMGLVWIIEMIGHTVYSPPG